jgi:hypothetical protein
MHPFESTPHDVQTGLEYSAIRRIIDALHNIGSRHYGMARMDVCDERERSQRIADKAQDMIDFLCAEFPG